MHGPYAPDAGHRFNPNKLLIDPYAKALHGELQWNDALFGYIIGHKDEDLSFSKDDSAPFMPKCMVVDTSFTWEDDGRTPRPWHETIIYEAHVKGLTMLREDVPEEVRGTFAGLSSPGIVSYLKDLGITAVELLPIHAFLHDRLLIEKGLRNYWGYNTLSFFAPHYEYLNGNGLNDVKNFIQTMHNADIEVILDVVFNHTAEGNHLGPTLSFRGIDNCSYYILEQDSKRYYSNVTGTGNALELRHPSVVRMATDSLRYWVQEAHVDGYRFDLATTLARVDGHFNDRAGFLDVVAQDPTLANIKLIAEPWDVGGGGYQLGNFPPGWSEWNDKYRDVVRCFIKGDGGQLPEFSGRISGSADLFDKRGRRPWAGINFVTAHDGFTLRDLVSYNEKHNEANQEGNNDGSNNNHSRNYGHEGHTDDSEIKALRLRQMKNFFAVLLLSQGVPMILAGDEGGNSQDGNNNAYCQDNDIGWIRWNDMEGADELLDFVRKLISLRKDHYVFHRSRFFKGDIINETTEKDVMWLRPDAIEMSEQDWADAGNKCLGMLLCGKAGSEHLTHLGKPENDDSFLLFMNAAHETKDIIFPATGEENRWRIIVDTSLSEPTEVNTFAGGESFRLIPYSIIVAGYVEGEGG